MTACPLLHAAISYPFFPTHNYMAKRIAYDVQITSIGDLTFLFLLDENGGRLIPVAQILSIVPNFRLGGSMIFLQGADKAIAVDQPPEEIYEALKSTNNE